MANEFGQVANNIAAEANFWSFWSAMHAQVHARIHAEAAMAEAVNLHANLHLMQLLNQEMAAPAIPESPEGMPLTYEYTGSTRSEASSTTPPAVADVDNVWRLLQKELNAPDENAQNPELTSVRFQ